MQPLQHKRKTPRLATLTEAVATNMNDINGNKGSLHVFLTRNIKGVLPQKEHCLNAIFQG